MANTEEQQGYIPDKVKKAEKKLEIDPYDTDAWSILIKDAQKKPINEARLLMEQCITRFPNAGRYWKQFIEIEVSYDYFFISAFHRLISRT